VRLKLKATVTDLKEIVKIQCSDGNWNYDPYMHGLANGVLLSLWTVEDLKSDVPFKDAPEKWLADKGKLRIVVKP
jgi:hypothetical protein